MSYPLEINHLRKSYKAGAPALDGVSLCVKQGDFFALLGPNGAGKSTLISIISSLVRKDGGQVSIFGHDIDTHFTAAKRCLGVVPQEFNFNAFEKVRDIIVNQAGYYGMHRAVAGEYADHYLDKLGLWQKRHEASRNLSGGMKRRLMIARALVHQPQLLVLDEPSAGVDIELRRSMWAFLEEINAQGTTIILTTHYLEEAEALCRNVAIINQGRIIERADMQSLLAGVSAESFVLDLSAAADTTVLAEPYQARMLDLSRLEVSVAKGQSLNEVFTQLSAQGIAVRSMRNKANRLEELFLGLISSEGAQL